MNWKNRFTNYNFWISIVSAVLLILQAFKFQFDIMYINEIATAVLGLLVVIGIINDPTKTSVKVENTVAKKESKKEIPLNNEEVKVEEINENINVESEDKVEEKIVEENLNTAEQMEENFPINEQGEIDAEHNENDFENLIEKISLDLSEEENNFKEMFKNLLNLLKNNEKTCEKSENLQNFYKIEEKDVKKQEEIKQETINEEMEEKEIVETNFENISNKNSADLNDTNSKFEKVSNKTDDMHQTEECETKVQEASSFNIVN